MNRPPATQASGFTLIEVMIGIVILAIAMAVGMPSYSQWIQNTNIRNAAESILNGMQRARAEAVSRNTNVEFTLGGDTFWSAKQVDTGDPIESRPHGEFSSNVIVTVSKPVVVPPEDSPTTITFTNLGTVFVPVPPTPHIEQLEIRISDSTRNLRITLGPGGNVRLCDPDPGVADTDPRFCPPD